MLTPGILFSNGVDLRSKRPGALVPTIKIFPSKNSSEYLASKISIIGIVLIGWFR